MANKQTGLQRARAPVDLFTLQPEEELVPAAASKKPVSAESSKRFKTSVELTPETLDLIDLIKTEYRRKHQKHLALWRILDEAVKLYASQLE